MSTPVSHLRRCLAAVVLLAAAGIVGAQTWESPNAGPFRTVSDGADDKLMLLGYDAVLTRVKRLVFRVPHYKTDRALREEWEAKLAAKTLPVMPGAPQVVPAN